MRALLGVTPPDDRLGVLQDIHWPTGAIGYFPCYTLGAILAAHSCTRRSRPSPICPHIAAGDFRPLLARLRANVHEQGARYETQELIARRHRPLARAATVPPPPRDPLSGLNPAPENIP